MPADDVHNHVSHSIQCNKTNRAIIIIIIIIIFIHSESAHAQVLASYISYRILSRTARWDHAYCCP